MALAKKMVLRGQGGLCRVETVHLRLQALQEEALSNGVDDVGDVAFDLSHFPVGLGFIGRFLSSQAVVLFPISFAVSELRSGPRSWSLRPARSRSSWSMRLMIVMRLV